MDIPKSWENYISHSFNRFYINPASGCRGGCVYCYIFDYGHPHIPKKIDVSGREVVDWLLSTPEFRPGRKGSVISIGSSCDPFSPEAKSKTMELLEFVTPLKNPVQISTKYKIEETYIRRIALLQVSKGQILLFSTVTSFNYWQTLERGIAAPNIRLKNLELAIKYGINPCLYIKPVLPGVTDTEIDIFVNAIQKYNIPFCTLGILYTNKQIIDNLHKRMLIDSISEFNLYNTLDVN